jgi:hypothetical protein
MNNAPVSSAEVPRTINILPRYFRFPAALLQMLMVSASQPQPLRSGFRHFRGYDDRKATAKKRNKFWAKRRG